MKKQKLLTDERHQSSTKDLQTRIQELDNENSNLKDTHSHLEEEIDVIKEQMTKEQIRYDLQLKEYEDKIQE